MRTAIYTKVKTHRIVSRPNGLWACQSWHPVTDKNGHVLRDNHRDPWRDMHRDTTKGEALRQLALYGEVDVSQTL